MSCTVEAIRVGGIGQVRKLVDPAPAPHFAIARAVVNGYADTVEDFLSYVVGCWAEPEGAYWSAVQAAEEAFDRWTEVAYDQSNAVDQDFDTVRAALESYRSWLERVEGDEWRRPGSEESANVNGELETALDLVRSLRVWNAVNPDSAAWSNRAWNAVDELVKEGGRNV